MESNVTDANSNTMIMPLLARATTHGLFTDCRYTSNVFSPDFLGHEGENRADGDGILLWTKYIKYVKTSIVFVMMFYIYYYDNI